MNLPTNHNLKKLVMEIKLTRFKATVSNLFKNTKAIWTIKVNVLMGRGEDSESSGLFSGLRN